MFTAKEGDRCTVRSHWQNDAQAVRKGVGRYFAKYAGKKESKQAWYCKRYPVSRFWGCCYALKRIIKEMSLTLSQNFESLGLADRYAANIIDKILKMCRIAYVQQYQFQVNVGTSDSPYIVADGDRTTFYIFPDMLMAIKEELSKVKVLF